MRVAIVGGGIGGAAAAIGLARQGHRVTVFERIARRSASIRKQTSVGAGLLLQPSGARVLDSLGCLDAVMSYSSKVRRLFGQNWRQKVVLDVHWRHLHASFFALGTPRQALYDTLHARLALEENASVRYCHSVQRIEAADGRQSRVHFDERRAHFGELYDLVVVASGALNALPAVDDDGAEVRRQSVTYPFGAVWALLDAPMSALGSEFRDDLLFNEYNTCRYMFGLMPSGTELTTLFWSVLPGDVDAAGAGDGLTFDERGRRLAHVDLDAFRAHVVGKTPSARGAMQYLRDADQLSLARYAGTSMAQFHYRRSPVVVLGDAAHAMSPQLGVGANVALIDAHVLADIASQCGDDPSTLAQRFTDARASAIRFYSLASTVLTPAFQSNSRAMALLRDALMGPLHYVPVYYRQSLLSLCGFKRGLLARSEPLDQCIELFDRLDRSSDA
jgi:2-polyprenyl-6-methoxyphenol hydroxylase-like FAD-dependent oxidoreductase